MELRSNELDVVVDKPKNCSEQMLGNLRDLFYNQIQSVLAISGREVFYEQKTAEEAEEIPNIIESLNVQLSKLLDSSETEEVSVQDIIEVYVDSYIKFLKFLAKDKPNHQKDWDNFRVKIRKTLTDFNTEKNGKLRHDDFLAIMASISSGILYGSVGIYSNSIVSFTNAFTFNELRKTTTQDYFEEKEKEYHQSETQQKIRAKLRQTLPAYIYLPGKIKTVLALMGVGLLLLNLNTSYSDSENNNSIPEIANLEKNKPIKELLMILFVMTEIFRLSMIIFAGSRIYEMFFINKKQANIMYDENLVDENLENVPFAEEIKSLNKVLKVLKMELSSSNKNGNLNLDALFCELNKIFESFINKTPIDIDETIKAGRRALNENYDNRGERAKISVEDFSTDPINGKVDTKATRLTRRQRKELYAKQKLQLEFKEHAKKRESKGLNAENLEENNQSKKVNIEPNDSSDLLDAISFNLTLDNKSFKRFLGFLGFECVGGGKGSHSKYKIVRNGTSYIVIFSKNFSYFTESYIKNDLERFIKDSTKDEVMYLYGIYCRFFGNNQSRKNFESIFQRKFIAEEF